MADWLDGLKELKQQAVAVEQARLSQERATAERLRAEQARILSVVKEIRLEPALKSLVSEILQGHPLFAAPSVVRTVTSRTATMDIEFREPAPWSGALEDGYLPDDSTYPDGHFISGIEWRLQTSYKGLGIDAFKFSGLRVLVTPSGVFVNGQGLTPLTEDTLQSRLVTVFREAFQVPATTKHRRRHHRHRRWYERLRGTLFPTRSSLALYLAVGFTMIVLALILGILVARGTMGGA